MSKSRVAVVRYEKPVDSVKEAVELSKGLDHLPAHARVFIKPNIVFWTRKAPFPKWGVITTSRVVEDMVRLLKERGIDHITIGEGMVTRTPKDAKTPAHAFESLGYGILEKRYGVRILNILERPFEKVNLGDGVTLNFNTDILSSDFVVDLPVMKAHNQTVVSLGIKNLKGAIDISSRKKCHTTDPQKDLHFMIAGLADRMPPMFTLIDGIFTNERGPGPDGRIHRTDLLVASSDVLSADLVGARLLGYEPESVPHLVHAAKRRNRPWDLTDIEIVGEQIEEAAVFHRHDFPYQENEDGDWLPVPLAKQGIRGISYRKYDLSMCTYCSGVNGVVLTAIRHAWTGEPFDDVEVLTGKSMQPTPGKKKTILLGKCMYKTNRDHPDIQEAIAVKGCPPKPDDIVKALHRAGIPVDENLFKSIDELPAFFMERYKGKTEFDPSLFEIDSG